MKNLKKIATKVAVVIVLFVGISTALSTVGVNTTTESRAAVNTTTVTNYLVVNGYYVVSAAPVSPAKGANWIAHTIFNGVNYSTTVYVSGGEIVGSASLPL